MKIQLPPPKKARIEMLPLIDIVFLLIVFFIYAMLSMAVHRGLTVELPHSVTAKLDQRQVLSITLKADETIYIDEEPVAFDDLAQVLKDKAGDAREPGVLLFADRALAYQLIYNVLDEVSRAGLSRISLQATSGE